MMIKPVCQDEHLAQQIHAARMAGRADAFDMWWLGQSGFLIQWNGSCLLFDPYLSDSLTKKYAHTGKPHVRMSERVIRPDLLDMVDAVTSSHNHTDHLDAETLQPLFRANPNLTFIIPEANRSVVCARLGCAPGFPIGMTDGDEVTVGPWKFFGVPAAHNTIERDRAGRCLFMGFVVRFGKFTVYHSGDTLWYPDLAEWIKSFQVDVAFLPINGNVPERGVAGNLNAHEAAALGKQVGVHCVVPHHYDLFQFNTADPAEFEEHCKAMQTPYRILKLGEQFTWR